MTSVVDVRVLGGGTSDKMAGNHFHRGLNISDSSLNISGVKESGHEVQFVLLRGCSIVSF